MNELKQQIAQYGLKGIMDPSHAVYEPIPAFEQLSESDKIELLVYSFTNRSTDNNLKFILDYFPHFFIQVCEDDRVLGKFDRSLWRVVPKPGPRARWYFPEVPPEQYKTLYMKLCIAAIKNDLPLIEMIDKDLLRDKEFVTMVVREPIDFGSDLDDWDKDVQEFVKKVMNLRNIDLRNLRTTNRKGPQGITHGTMRVIPHGKVEDFLGLKRGGTKRRRRIKKTKRR
jgi:hypothetical protein